MDLIQTPATPDPAFVRPTSDDLNKQLAAAEAAAADFLDETVAAEPIPAVA